MSSISGELQIPQRCRTKAHYLPFSLALGLLLATIETSITATALVTIGEYFHNSVTVSLSALHAWSRLTLSTGNMGGSGISFVLHGYV